MASDLARTADIYFRTFALSTMPLHQALVEDICALPEVPLELATVLEDIGQMFLTMAGDVNATLERQGRLSLEAEADDTDETRIVAHVTEMIARAGVVTFIDGRSVDAAAAVSTPLAINALKAALTLARGSTVQRLG